MRAPKEGTRIKKLQYVFYSEQELSLTTAAGNA